MNAWFRALPRALRVRLPMLLLSLALSLQSAAAPVMAQDDPPDTTRGPPPAGKPAEAPAVADAPEPPPPIYEDQLLRLAEILGSLMFLRDLCGAGDGRIWRAEMSALLDAEHPGRNRRAHLVGRFNHGFETFAAGYRSCTPAARLSISRYLDEGRKLSATVRSRYSQ